MKSRYEITACHVIGKKFRREQAGTVPSYSFFCSREQSLTLFSRSIIHKPNPDKINFFLQILFAWLLRSAAGESGTISTCNLMCLLLIFRFSRFRIMLAFDGYNNVVW